MREARAWCMARLLHAFLALTIAAAITTGNAVEGSTPFTIPAGVRADAEFSGLLCPVVESYVQDLQIFVHRDSDTYAFAPFGFVSKDADSMRGYHERVDGDRSMLCIYSQSADRNIEVPIPSPSASAGIELGPVETADPALPPSATPSISPTPSVTPSPVLEIAIEVGGADEVPSSAPAPSSSPTPSASPTPSVTPTPVNEFQIDVGDSDEAPPTAAPASASSAPSISLTPSVSPSPVQEVIFDVGDDVDDVPLTRPQTAPPATASASPPPTPTPSVTPSPVEELSFDFRISGRGASTAGATAGAAPPSAAPRPPGPLSRAPTATRRGDQSLSDRVSSWERAVRELEGRVARALASAAAQPTPAE